MDRAARRRAANTVFVGLCGIATVIALVFLELILWTLLSKGVGGIDARIFTMDQPPPGSPGSRRGRTTPTPASKP